MTYSWVDKWDPPSIGPESQFVPLNFVAPGLRISKWRLSSGRCSARAVRHCRALWWVLDSHMDKQWCMDVCLVGGLEHGFYFSYNDIVNIFIDYNHILKNHFNYNNDRNKIFNFLTDNNHSNCNINQCNYFKRMSRNYYYHKNERNHHKTDISLRQLLDEIHWNFIHWNVYYNQIDEVDNKTTNINLRLMSIKSSTQMLWWMIWNKLMKKWKMRIVKNMGMDHVLYSIKKTNLLQILQISINMMTDNRFWLLWGIRQKK